MRPVSPFEERITDTRKLLVLIGAAALAATAPIPAPAAGHDHAHGAAAPARLALDQGRKWPTDEPLRAGMTHIRAAVEKELPAVHGGRETPAQYRAMVAEIEKEVGGVVQNCRLEPRADAMLHLVLADMLAGVEAMKGKQRTVSRQKGVVRVVQALEDYGRYFDHPDWKALAH